MARHTTGKIQLFSKYLEKVNKCLHIRNDGVFGCIGFFLRLNLRDDGARHLFCKKLVRIVRQVRMNVVASATVMLTDEKSSLG